MVNSKVVFAFYLEDLSGNNVDEPLLHNVSGFRFSTQYPGGTHTTAAFFLARDVLKRPLLIRVGQKLTVRAGHRIIYFGLIDGLEDIQTGTRVTCVGPWTQYMERRGLDIRWADTDLTRWTTDVDANGAELGTSDTNEGRLRITPKAEAWTTNDQHRLEYIAATGQGVGRVETSWTLTGANWTLRIKEGLAGANVFEKTAAGTGTENNNTAADPSTIYFHLESDANQTPAADGSVHAELTSLTVRSAIHHASRTVASCNVYEVALDILDLMGVDESNISGDTDDLNSTLTVALLPFTTNGFEMFGSILARAASFGDSSQGPIGFGLRSPGHSSDFRPKLFLEKYPVLTDHDYDVTLSDPGVSIRENADAIWNWIIIDYADKEGAPKRVTPDDDANLTDSDSVTKYGRREKIIGIGQVTSAGTAEVQNDQADAILYGRRFLTRHKNPVYSVSRPVRLSRIRTKGGGWIPAAWIEAGKRVRIIDLPNLIGQAGPTGTTFLITRTQYDHDTGIASISLGGAPDSLAVLLAQMQRGIV